MSGRGLLFPAVRKGVLSTHGGGFWKEDRLEQGKSRELCCHCAETEGASLGEPFLGFVRCCEYPSRALCLQEAPHTCPQLFLEHFECLHWVTKGEGQGPGKMGDGGEAPGEKQGPGSGWLRSWGGLQLLIT